MNSRGERRDPPPNRKPSSTRIRGLSAAGVQPGGDVIDGKRGWTQDVPLGVSEIAGNFMARLNVSAAPIALRQGDEITVLASHLPGTRVLLEACTPRVRRVWRAARPSASGTISRGWTFEAASLLVLMNDPDFEADLSGRFGGPCDDVLRPVDLQVRGGRTPWRGSACSSFTRQRRRPTAGPTVRNSIYAPRCSTSSGPKIPAAVHPPVEGVDSARHRRQTVSRGRA